MGITVGVVNDKGCAYIVFMPGPKPIYTEDLHLVVDPALKAALNSFAEVSHTAVAQVVRTALREYLACEQLESVEPKKVVKVVGATKNAPHRRVTPIEPVVTEPLDDTRAQQERMDDFYRANMAKAKK